MIHSIVYEMEAEDQTAIEMEEYEGSSDDEQFSLPKEWKEYGFGSHVAEDVRNQKWEYRGNEVVQGATSECSGIHRIRYPPHNMSCDSSLRFALRSYVARGIAVNVLTSDQLVA